MCRHSKTTWQTLEPAVIALVTRGVVQLEFKVDYVEWEHGSTPFQIVRCSLGNKSHWWNTKINTNRTARQHRLINENRQFFVRGLMNIKFGNTVVIAPLSRLCMTFRVECSRTIQAALAVQFLNGTQLELVFVSAAMSIRSLDNEHFPSDMTSYFFRNPFRTVSCEISAIDLFTD